MKPSSLMDPEALRRAEALYRRSLEKDPGDMTSRRSLAWSLFVRAIYQAGREVEREVAGAPADAEEAGADSAALLAECLKQISMVLQLSRNTHDVREMEHLRSLLRLSGAESAVSASEMEALEILASLAREFSGEEHPRRHRLRRMRTRQRDR
jgi:hypothetical protein